MFIHPAIQLQKLVLPAIIIELFRLRITPNLLMFVVPSSCTILITTTTLLLLILPRWGMCSTLTRSTARLNTEQRKCLRN